MYEQLFKSPEWQKELYRFFHDTSFGNTEGKSYQQLEDEFQSELVSNQNYLQSDIEKGRFSIVCRVENYLESDIYRDEAEIRIDSLVSVIHLSFSPAKYFCACVIDSFKCLVDLQKLTERVQSLSEYKDLRNEVEFTEEVLNQNIGDYFQWKRGIVPHCLKNQAMRIISQKKLKTFSGSISVTIQICQSSRVDYMQPLKGYPSLTSVLKVTPFQPASSQVIQSEGIPCFLTEQELRNLYGELVRTGKVASTDFKNFYESFIEGRGHINWLGTIIEFSVLIIYLHRKGKLSGVGFWQGACSVFLFNGKQKSVSHVANAHSKVIDEKKRDMESIVQKALSTQ